LDASLLIVGLAPGRNGANRTGRPFTGDFAGDLLYATLLKKGFASGEYRAALDDGLTLRNCRITNAVRCVPPENKPTPLEVNTCGQYLKAEISSMPNLKIAIALGRIAHDAILAALVVKKSQFEFKHAAVHAPAPLLSLIDSYHCSRYNTNTGRLTPEMFETVFDLARRILV
jgi:uracil-DNA glycosylase family 4